MDDTSVHWVTGGAAGGAAACSLWHNHCGMCGCTGAVYEQLGTVVSMRHPCPQCQAAEAGR